MTAMESEKPVQHFPYPERYVKLDYDYLGLSLFVIDLGVRQQSRCAPDEYSTGQISIEDNWAVDERLP